MLKRLAWLAVFAPAAALAVTGVASPIQMALVTRAANPGGEASFVRALEPARAALSQERIGFLSQHPVDVSQGGPAELYYYLAQYALAPLLVEPGPLQQTVLVVDPRPGRLEALLAEPRVELRLELAPGMAIVEARPDAP